MHFQRARDAHLLLVAAGQRSGELIHRSAANVQLIDHPLGFPADRLFIAQGGDGLPEQLELLQEIIVHLHCVENHVIGDGLIQQKTHLAAILADHRDAALQRIAGFVQFQRFAAKFHFALGGVQTHHAVRNADLALTRQTADAQNFALVYGERYILDLFAGHADLQMADLHGDFIGKGLFARGGFHHAFASSAHHQLRQFQDVGILRGLGGDQMAVAQDGDGVRRRHNLIQAVGDENNRDAACRDLLHHANQLFRFGFRQHGGRLIEYQQLDALLIDFARNFYKLHIAYGQTADVGVIFNGHADQRKRLLRVLAHGGHIQRFQILAERAGYEIRPGDFAVQLDVFGNGKAAQQHEFLMNHADAPRHRIVRGHEMRFFTVQQNLALESAGIVNHRHTKEHVHQSGLTCAVFAQQRMNFARPDGKTDVFQNRIFAVALGNALHLEYIFGVQTEFLLISFRTPAGCVKIVACLRFACNRAARRFTNESQTVGYMVRGLTRLGEPSGSGHVLGITDNLQN